MKKALIVGANGYVGTNLCNKLVSTDIDVIALVQKGSDYSLLKNLERVNCIEFELATIDELEDSLLLNVDVLFHLAWSGVSSANKNFVEKQTQNILYGIKVMYFSEKHNIKRVIVAGSASEYAYCNEVITGFNIPYPSDIYSASKIATRYVCQTYANQKGISFIWTAITSVYGPGRNDNNLITYSIKTLLENNKPSFTKLEQRWDYVFIDDLIDALILIGHKGKDGMIYPIGSGISRKMIEYVNIIRNSIDPQLKLGIGDLPYKNKMIDNQILDISSLQNDTGYLPKYSFEEGIQLTIEYFKKNI